MAVNCVKVGLKSCIGKLIPFFKDKFEFWKFQKSLEEWIEAFVCENEVSILASSAFSNYLEYYNLLEHIFFYITDTDSSALPERQFITKEIEKLEVYLKRQGCTGIPNDHSVKDTDTACEYVQKAAAFYEEDYQTLYCAHEKDHECKSYHGHILVNPVNIHDGKMLNTGHDQMDAFRNHVSDITGNENRLIYKRRTR